LFNTHNLEIRLATLNDIEPLCQLYCEFFAYNAALQPMYYKAGIENGRYPASVISSENADIILAVEDKKVVGFIHIREAQTLPYDVLVPYKYAEVIDLMTTAAHRKEGIGSGLIDAAKQWARTRHLDYIELFVLCEAKNQLRFYANRDFAVVSHTMRCPL